LWGQGGDDALKSMSTPEFERLDGRDKICVVPAAAGDEDHVAGLMAAVR
jgi:hypothetical protein